MTERNEILALADRIEATLAYDGLDLDCTLRRQDQPEGSGVTSRKVIFVCEESREVIANALRAFVRPANDRTGHNEK